MKLRAGRFRPWPRSLAARTAVVLLLGLAVVQIAGLTIHALDRIDLQRLEQARNLSLRVMNVYRAVAAAPPAARAEIAADLGQNSRLRPEVADHPPLPDLPPARPFFQRMLRADMILAPMPMALQPREIAILGGPPHALVRIGLRMPDGQWLLIQDKLLPPRPWHSTTFLIAFVVMTLAAALLTVWAVRRLTAPVRTLAAAAEALGRDVNAPPLPEDGPTEVAKAAAAFNTMAGRIRRFVHDRTLMLTAIGHDLRTPITRLKLRCELMEDEELSRKMLADLDEMEAMVAATLAFGRDASDKEPVSPLDLPTLLRTLLDEAGDARPEAAEKLTYDGPEHLTIRARPRLLKRALANLVNNAVAYGGLARITVAPPQDGTVQVRIEDDGPGVPPGELDRVFEPFHRVEASRNRETGGVGLGLPIARNILRAHGGDVTLGNRAGGGACATVTLPV